MKHHDAAVQETLEAISACKTCGKHPTLKEVRAGAHTCLPLFEVQCERFSDFDDDNPTGLVYCARIEQAAKTYAEYNSSELEFYAGEAEFRVRSPGGEWTTVTVTAERTTDYSSEWPEDA